MAKKTGTIFVDPQIKKKIQSSQDLIGRIQEKKDHPIVMQTPTLDKPPIPFEAVKENTDKLESLLHKSQRILIKVRTVFPFKLFPTTVVVDENKLTIIYTNFFFSKSIDSVIVPSMKDIEAETSLFFGTLKILPEAVQEQWICVNYLRKHDAIKVRRIVQGLMVGVREGIDFSKVQTKNLTAKIEALGAVNS